MTAPGIRRLSVIQGDKKDDKSTHLMLLALAYENVYRAALSLLHNASRSNLRALAEAVNTVTELRQGEKQ